MLTDSTFVPLICPTLIQACDIKGSLMSRYAYLEHGSAIPRQLRFRAFLGCYELLEMVKPGARILDLGGGDGLHARFFRNHGFEVDIIDLEEGMEPLAYKGQYEDFVPDEKYDVIWCSHVYEHIINPGRFLSKIYYDLRPGGYAAITVPPMKSDMLFEHVTLWNAGLLLIHLIKSGFDCRQARLASYHYNITAIAQRPSKALSLSDKDMLPSVEWKGNYFEGNIRFLNWNNQQLSIDPSLNFRDKQVSVLLDHINQLDRCEANFGMAQIPDSGKVAYMYIDHDRRIIVPTG